jgi:hypothetical protein
MSDRTGVVGALKVLDLFCGRGGWSGPFVEDGDLVWGYDIKDFSNVYPGIFIQMDLKNFHQSPIGIDFVVGSTPCDEFSIAIEMWKYRGRPRDIEKGLNHVRQFKRIVQELKPRFWALENVEYGEKWISPIIGTKPSWHFKISKGGRRCLWSNFPIPLVAQPDFERRIWYMSGTKGKDKRAEIPYPIARFIADTVKAQITILSAVDASETA